MRRPPIGWSAFAHGQSKRLIINQPPRSHKSMTASVAWPAFGLGHDPTRKFICVSYSAELGQKAL